MAKPKLQVLLVEDRPLYVEAIRVGLEGPTATRLRLLKDAQPPLDAEARARIEDLLVANPEQLAARAALDAEVRAHGCAKINVVTGSTYDPLPSGHSRHYDLVLHGKLHHDHAPSTFALAMMMQTWRPATPKVFMRSDEPPGLVRFLATCGVHRQYAHSDLMVGLLDAVADALRGKMHFSPHIKTMCPDVQLLLDNKPWPLLEPRLRKALLLSVELNNDRVAMAETMGHSANTVRSYLSQASKLLGVLNYAGFLKLLEEVPTFHLLSRS